jgi:hypothetical protein
MISPRLMAMTGSQGGRVCSCFGDPSIYSTF